ncbi:MAG: 23S rRNA (guanosine(2251)-2'-O)-methyltransferase RlmB [Synechococcaceae cyanobacterium]
MSAPSDRRFDPRPERGRPRSGGRPGAGAGRPGAGRFGSPRPRRGREEGGESPWQRSGDRPWRPADRSADRPGPRPVERAGERGGERPGERGERPFRPGGRFERGERPERGPRFRRPDRPASGDRFPRPARPGRPDRFGPGDRFGRPDRLVGEASEGVSDTRAARGPRKSFRDGPPGSFRRAERPAPSFARSERSAEPQGDAASHGPDTPSDLIWGRHAALAALESGRPVHRIWCTPEMRFSPRFLQLLREAKASGVLVEEVTWARLGQISAGGVHQGIVLQPAAAESLDLPSLLDGCRDLAEAPLLIALDGLTDPQNLGSIVRSAEALGAHGLVLPQRRSAGLTGSVAKVAAGALEHLPVARVVNLNRALDALKQEGYRVVGLAGEGSVTLEEADLSGPLVVVTGSEGDGLSMLTRRSCDQLVRVPLRGATPSLNAGVATALVLYEVARRSWMHGLRGTAPAPRLERPAVPSLPLPHEAAPSLLNEEALPPPPIEPTFEPEPAHQAAHLPDVSEPELPDQAEPLPNVAEPMPERPSWMPPPADTLTAGVAAEAEAGDIEQAVDSSPDAPAPEDNGSPVLPLPQAFSTDVSL